MSIRKTGYREWGGGAPSYIAVRGVIRNDRYINDLAEFPAVRPELGEERGKDGYVRSRRRLAPQIGVDHPPAGIDRDGVAEIVRSVENGPGRFAARSVQIVAKQSHGRPFNPSILRTA